MKDVIHSIPKNEENAFCMILQTKCDQLEKEKCLECPNYLHYKKYYLDKGDE